ncbi:MAG: uroporphyrinogen-III C-methyltransferase [bacterium]|nr:uroporphyrinogen-III C-methyltransferase [bacterium]
MTQDTAASKGIVYLVGAGPGDPDLITVKACNAMAEADCIIYDFLANSALLREYTCEKIYVGKQGSDHTLTQENINALIIKKSNEGKTIVRLKGGDPYIFGRGGEEAEELVEAGIPFCIIPGISSFYSAPAYAGIPLTHRDFANAFQVITGHRRADASPEEDINFPEYDPDRTYAFLMGMKNLAHISKKLIEEKGFPAETPVAVISWGTRPEQRTVSGPLKEIAAISEKASMQNPAIILVGSVVSLRDKLRWFDTLPLFGKKIVITRTRKQASKISKKLLKLGAAIIEFPTIEIKPEQDQGPLKEAIKRLNEFNWLLFTSQNAVQIFFDTLFELGLDVRKLGAIKIAVIGPATGNELINYGLKPDCTPEKFVAESLLETMSSLGMNGQKILLPCSADARPTLAEGLKEMGATVERVHTYRTALPEDITPDDLKEIEHADIITFASSSTVKNFFSLVPSPKAKLASIGPVTSQAIRDFGFEPEVTAEEYTIDGLVRGILEKFDASAPLSTGV